MNGRYANATITCLLCAVGCGGPAATTDSARPLAPVDRVEHRGSSPSAQTAYASRHLATDEADETRLGEHATDSTPVAEHLWHGDRDSRDLAIELTLTGRNIDLVALNLLLTDPDPSVRQEAIDVLGERGRADVRAHLDAARSDPHPGVRQAAHDALAEIASDG